MRVPTVATLAILVVFAPRMGSGAETPQLPHDPEAQGKYYRDLLAWSHRTWEGAYDAAGKKDPKWDGKAPRP